MVSNWGYLAISGVSLRHATPTLDADPIARTGDHGTAGGVVTSRGNDGFGTDTDPRDHDPDPRQRAVNGSFH